MDRRFLGIGDLPSNGNVKYSFTSEDVCVRPLEVGDLTPLNVAINQNSIRNVLRVLNHCVSTDIYSMTEGDLFYVMAWIRLFSFPKSAVTVTWTCKEQVIVNLRNHVDFQAAERNYSLSRMKDLGLKYAVCETTNTVPLTDVSVKQIRLPQGIELPDYLDFPRVDTLIEYDEYYADDGKLEYAARIARWIKDGKTLKDKIKKLNSLVRKHGVGIMGDIEHLYTKYYHGMKDVYVLDCRRCDTKTRVEKDPDIIKFFSTTTEESLLNMQYNLSNAINMVTDEDTPTKKILYWHSCYEKDLREKEEKRRLKESQRKGGKR